MKCTAVTPERTVFETDVKFVVVPLYDGEYGIGLDHSPVVGRLGAGEVRLTLEDDSVEYWFVEGGFVEVANNVVSLITNRSCKLTDLNVGDARRQLDEALELPKSSLAHMEIRNEAVAVASARLKAAEKAAALK